MNLFFANRYSGTTQPGQRVFNVALDGTTVLPNYDIVADVGDQTGTEKSFTITSDGTVNIDLTNGPADNALINGIEIVNTSTGGGGTTPPTGPTTSDLAYRAYTSTTIGTLTTVPNTGIDWSTTRGAFMAGNTIFYGSTDGNFYKASFNGSSVGTPVSIDPYNDPLWDNKDTGSGQTYQGVRSDFYSEIGNVTGAFYNGGRMYYSLLGQSTLFWRWFSPDSGIIGGTQYSASGGDFSNTAGEFLSGSTLYYANRADGTLHTVSFSAGVVSGTDTVVSGPSVDGNDWRARSLFAYGTPNVPNQLPTASATSSCTDLTCSFDGTNSSDPDGTIASYAWTFGDGSTGTGAKPSHGYAATGTYNVSLVVTDNRGGQSTAWTGSVSVTAPAVAPISYVAAAHSYSASGTSPTVTVPAGVHTGDTELLTVTTNNVGLSSAPSGWTKIAQQASSTVLQTTVYKRTASAGDAATVTAPLSASAGTALELAVYRSVGSATPVVAGAQDSSTSSHVAPAVAVSTGGSWVVNVWSDKSSTTTAWTTAGAVSQRDTAIGTGSGRSSSTLADSGAPVASGTYPAQTATVTGGASGKGAMLSIVLTPAAPAAPNQLPTANATTSCTNATCTFDGSTSSDNDGTVQSYAWTFGDNATGTGKTTSHTYAASGTYNVSLTVTDDQGGVSNPAWTGTVTVTVPAVAPISYVGVAHAYSAASSSPSVVAPAGIQSGDTELLTVSTNTTGTITAPSGWTLVATQTSSTVLQTSVFRRTATGSESGSTLSVPLTASSGVALQLAVYRGVGTATIVAAGAADASVSAHVAPSVSVATSGSWVVNVWSDKSSTTTAWTVPAAVSGRDSDIGTGGGRVTVELADSGSAVTAGTYPSQTATVTGGASGKGAMLSLVLAPQS